jgi:hypothetical protein
VAYYSERIDTAPPLLTMGQVARKNNPPKVFP